MRVIAFVAVLLPTVAGLALADSMTMELVIPFSSIRIPQASLLTLGQAQLRAHLDAGLVADSPVFLFDNDLVTARQYWQNVTIVRDPEGAPVRVSAENPESLSLGLSVRSLWLSDPVPQADLRLALDPEGLFGFGGVSAISAQSGARGLDDTGWTTEFPNLTEFRGPEEAERGWGWLSFQTSNLIARGGLSILVDGWGVRLEGEGEHKIVRTGSYFEPLESGDGTPIQAGAAERRVYTIIVLSTAEVDAAVSSAVVALAGNARDFSVMWDGLASMGVPPGTQSGGSKGDSERLDLVGRFRADVEFGLDESRWSSILRADGVGSLSLSPPSYHSSAVAPPTSLTNLWQILAVGAVAISLLASQAFFVARRARTRARVRGKAARTGPQGASLSRRSALVRLAPLDAKAQFEFGVELFRRGDVVRALNHLERAFRLEPERLLRFLQDSRFAWIRGDARVLDLLRGIHREQQRRVWAGYA